jgi:DNA-nicking Smr family endonuclease
MPKQRATFSLDESVLRATRVAAARAGQRDSEVVEDALRRYLAIGVLEEIWRTRSPDAPELSDDDAIRLARDEQHAARKGRRARRAEETATKLKVDLEGMTETERESTLRELLAALDSKSRERLLKG